MNAIIAVFLLVTSTSGQFLHQEPIPLAYYRDSVPIHEDPPLAHPAVVENSIREKQLPPELLKSDNFYSNPRVADGLAKESWFTDKEMPVFEREAEKIPREQIVKILTNAGLARRR
ncbi:uncharacterized protein LOC129796899 [Lutzomyia longipalpis]|uniref:Uncharacterized protein n=1 Tax=Lutzomyia longipalpis TaxID=7200 RepID=A0A1B0CK41_LUTLO|nr:uncharacterized protein LOC129796899 [Lutzomyia longipalpis]